MIKTVLFSLLAIALYSTSYCNINSIDFNKISYYEEIKSEIGFVLEHQGALNHWQYEWSYPISKKQCLKTVKSISEVCEKQSSTYEEFLLQGVLAHFRYNLNDEDQFKEAVNAFNQAKQIDAYQYRAFWFSANHYAHSNVPDSAIANYQKATSLNPEIQNSEFWEEFAFAHHLANMPSHAIMAMEKATEILGEPSYYEKTLGEIIRKSLPVPEAEEVYELQDVWSYMEAGEKAVFISRPLGLKFQVDTNWRMNFGQYQNRISYAMITPDAETDVNGKEITYSIMVMAHVPTEETTIEDYTNKFLKNYTEKNSYDKFSSLNPNYSFELKDSTMYSELGGGHMHLMSFVKGNPDYPGIRLESPTALPTIKTKKKKPGFFRFNSKYHRFDQDIMYIVMLDTCEDIYDKSLKVYESFLESLIIE